MNSLIFFCSGSRHSWAAFLICRSLFSSLKCFNYVNPKLTWDAAKKKPLFPLKKTISSMVEMFMTFLCALCIFHIFHLTHFGFCLSSTGEIMRNMNTKRYSKPSNSIQTFFEFIARVPHRYALCDFNSKLNFLRYFFSFCSSLH